ncbi:MAG: hypothetical protein ACRD1A_13180, partial [Terriglobales bacterium]
MSLATVVAVGAAAWGVASAGAQRIVPTTVHLHLAVAHDTSAPLASLPAAKLVAAAADCGAPNCGEAPPSAGAVPPTQQAAATPPVERVGAYAPATGVIHPTVESAPAANTTIAGAKNLSQTPPPPRPNFGAFRRGARGRQGAAG